MVSLDYSLGIQIVNFLLLIVVLNLLLYKPLLGIIDKRKKELSDAEEEVRQLKELAAQKMAAYEEQLRLAKAAALQDKNELLHQASAEAKAILEEVRREIPSLMEEFHLRLENEVAKARQELSAQAEQFSREIAQKVLGRRLP